MDDSLEALIDKATNPRNKYEDWEFIMQFCDKVNIDAQGPQVALQLIVPKMRDPNEKVAALSLAVLEACVKNCGQRFHSELGKFRFLNELIRMISPKYLGEVTPNPIKDKIKSLIYSWKLGLPNEPKIQDAYEMLKKEGLIFDESVGPDPTLEQARTKPKITLKEDPKQAQMLQKLLASKNPDDLRAANRLIRDMVRRDDKRMQKLQKRLEELELIQNNTKLLSELLSHYNPSSSEQEKLLIKELYRSLDGMRPNLMRMASNLKNSEEGMADILAANENLLRVTDTYKRVIETNGESPSNGETTNSTTPAATEQSASNQATGGVASPQPGGGASEGGVLIDLADLDFGPPPVSVPANNTTGGEQDGNISSLIDDLGLLDLPPIGNSQLAAPPNPSPQSVPTATMQNLLGPGFPTPQFSMPGFAQPMTSQATPPLLRPPPGSNFTIPPIAPATPPQQRPQAATPPQQRTTPALNDPFADLCLLTSPTADPLEALDQAFVPLESIQTSTLPPLNIMSKDNVSVSFHFAKNCPSPGVSVVVISVLSSNPNPISNFQFQAAVPKVMRVKLQPPSSTTLNAFNPILPPSTITQIMLMANPSKAKARMKFRVSYNMSGQELVEMGEVSEFPETT